MASTSKSNSNGIFKTIIIILLVLAVAYLIYYLYSSSPTKSNGSPSMPPQHVFEEGSNYRQILEQKMQANNGGMVQASGSASGHLEGTENPIMAKMNTLRSPGGNIVGQTNMDQYSMNEGFENQRPAVAFPKDTLTAQELLPQDNANLWAQVNPSGEGSLKDRNFLQSGYHVGINTVGQTLRNANLQLRSEPPCPQVKVSPWLQSTIEPDVSRLPFEIGSCGP